MLEVKCPEYLAEIREFADSAGLRDDLERNLDALSKFGDRCELGKDCQPHFRFSVYRRTPMSDEYFLFKGGLIYEGPDQPADGSFPSLTVSIGKPIHGWRIHT
jgi:hypothetical protein